MYRLIGCLLAAIPLFSQEIHFSYYDRGFYEEKEIHLDKIQTKWEREDIESAYMLTLCYPINPSSILSLYGGTSLARYDVVGDEMYAYTTYLSARLSPLSLLTVTPFVELSLGGPTYLSKKELGEIDFRANIVYQHFLAVGVKAAAFVFSVKMVNYSENLGTAFTKESVSMPFILSAGCCF
ncbi:hypothetical protein K0U07_04240 [bacterium]|nr:hypothetical protein [bacterium]